MGTESTLSSTLFGRTRGVVLAVLYGHVGESFYLRQLARNTGIALGPVQRELRQLADAGLVKKETLGKQTLYSANEDSPVFAEIKNLVTRIVNPASQQHALATIQAVGTVVTAILALVESVSSKAEVAQMAGQSTIKLAAVRAYLNENRSAEIVAGHYAEPVELAHMQVEQVEHAEVQAGF